MKNMTKKLTQGVRDALLAMSDKELRETILEWLDRADERLLYEECQPGNGRAMYPELADEFRFALGYRLRSTATGKQYSSVEQVGANDDDSLVDVVWAIPEEEEVRDILLSFSLQEFYHIVIGLAGYALADKAEEHQWGPAPSRGSDGYEFIRNLKIVLQGTGKLIRDPYEDMKAEWESMGLEWEDTEVAVHDRFGDVAAVRREGYHPL